MKKLKRIIGTTIWVLLFVGALATVLLFIYDWIQSPIEMLEKSFEFIKTALTVVILFVLIIVLAINWSTPIDEVDDTSK